MGETNPEIIGLKEKLNKIEEIKTRIRCYRQHHDITPTPGRKDELSCIAFGEENNLLWSLIKTIEGDGAWKELEEDKTGEIIEMVLKETKKPKWN